MKEPTTREVLTILYNQIEERRKQHCEKAYGGDSVQIESAARYAEAGTIQAMIVGLENEYNI